MSLPMSPSRHWNADRPRADNEVQLVLDLEAWIRSDTLRRLAAAWGGIAPRNVLNSDALYDWFDKFSLTHWDFRGGKERTFTDVSRLSQAQVEVCLESATALGMMDGRKPTRQNYDYVLVLGGLARACLTRTQYVSDLVAHGSKFGEIVALGGSRRLGVEEIEFARSQGLDADSEFEAMVEAMRIAFGVAERPQVLESNPPSLAFGDWAVAKFNGSSISIHSAPSRAPGTRRANTADTFAWWGEREGPLDGKHLLVVTTAIYVPYQGAVAIEELGISFNASIETVGASAEAPYLGSKRLFSPENYLQEVRSTIRGYWSLYRKLRSAYTPRIH